MKLTVVYTILTIIATSLFMGIACAELVRTAWIADDAAITLRTVLNFIHGYGPTFNLDERVQAYTHPLWFLLISLASFVTGNVFYSTFALSVITSLAVYWLLIKRIAPDWRYGMLVTAILLLSKAYVDFSTSGLENPLSHLMLVLLVLSARQPIQATQPGGGFQPLLLCASLYLVRPDLVLVGLPLYVWLVRKHFQGISPTLRMILLSGAPVMIWTLFSLVYYGFPFPNTAYAKLGAGIPLLERLAQGYFYLLESFSRDPVTLAAILAGTTWGLCNRGLERMLALGNLLYLAYIISIGGDFMSGRLLTPVLLIATVLLAGRKLSWRSIPSNPLLAQHKTATNQPWVIYLLLVLGAININATLFSPQSLSDQTISRGIADERGYYFQKFGLLNAAADTFQASEWVPGKRKVTSICGGLGFTSIQVGSGTHLIDTCALADPLLARLPAKYNPKWRIGHFIRTLPTHYKTSVSRNHNTLVDPLIRDYYAIIYRITHAPLLDRARLLDIARINLGLIRPDFSYYRFHQEDSVQFTVDGQPPNDAAILVETGELHGRTAVAQAGLDGAGFLAYGPYLKLAPGAYRLEMTYTSSAPPQKTVGKHDIAASRFGQVAVLAEKALQGTGGQPITISTIFHTPQDAEASDNLYEFRTYWDGTADMQVSAISLHSLPP